MSYRYAFEQNPLSELGQDLSIVERNTKNQNDVYNNPNASKSNKDIDTITKGLKSDQLDTAKEIAESQAVLTTLEKIKNMPNGPTILNILKTEPQFQVLENKVKTTTSPTLMNEKIQDNNIDGTVQEMLRSTDVQSLIQQNINRANSIAKHLDRNKKNQSPMNENKQQLVAFNLLKHKKAQIQVDDPTQELQQEAGFVTQYLKTLLSFSGMNKNHDNASEQSKSEILAMVSPAAQEEANSELEKIQQLNPLTGNEEGKRILEHIYRNWIAPKAAETIQSTINTVENGNQNMSEQPNHMSTPIAETNENNLTKVAQAAQFGSPYILYGPSEKRICPKLRGRGVGDVVSEYTCRHHCLDGIVIDDNKTICGEALWRANAMDKFSTEYVDENGEIVGGYINKRFHVHRDVPEENNMRLKPGEMRKPLPAAWGSLESRMQNMRASEGEKRNYKPNTDTSKPFNWNKDVDQNNVEQTQEERDRREEASGHELVKYKNKDQQENNPKKAFNLKNYKTAQMGDLRHNGFSDGGEMYTDDELDLMEQSKCKTCGGDGMLLGTLGKLRHFRCRNCGSDFSHPINQTNNHEKPMNTENTDVFASTHDVNKNAQFLTKGPYPFADKQKQYNQYTLDQLNFAIKDIQETIEVIGRDHPNVGWYTDDLHTVLEVKNRKLKTRKPSLASPLIDDGKPIQPVDSTIRHKELPMENIPTMAFNLNNFKKTSNVIKNESDNSLNLKKKVN